MPRYKMAFKTTLYENITC